MLSVSEIDVINGKLKVIGTTASSALALLANHGYTVELDTVVSYLDTREDLVKEPASGWPRVYFYSLEPSKKLKGTISPKYKQNRERKTKERCYCHCPCTRTPFQGDDICQECMKGNHMKVS